MNRKLITKSDLVHEWIPSKTTEEMLRLHKEERLKYLSSRLDVITTAEYLSRTDIEKFLGVSTQTVINWELSGIIKRHGIGDKIRYNRADVIQIADRSYEDEELKRLRM